MQLCETVIIDIILTSSLVNGAITEPSPSHSVVDPIPMQRTTEGKTSSVYASNIPNATVMKNLPIIAAAMIVSGISALNRKESRI